MSVTSELIWEWEKSKDQWCRYSKEKSETMGDGFLAGNSAVSFEEGGVQFELNFDKMLQRNSQTGFERRVRCACIERGDDGHYEFYAWQWLDERQRWQNYTAAVSTHLEKEFRKTAGVASFVVSGRSYTVDMTKMQQTNDTTGVVRPVQRIKSDADVAVEISVKRLPASAPKRTGSRSTEDTKGAKPSVKPKESSGKFEKDDSESEDKALNLKNGKKTMSRKAAARDSDDEPLSKRKNSSDARKADDEPDAKKSRSTKSSVVVKSTVRTLVVKGKAPVDPECSRGNCHVYYEGANVYDCMLNQTNVQNNNNKYYIIQLLEDDASAKFSVWQRWGRVGFAGQSNLVPCGTDLEKAKNAFCKKFFDKTKNEWSDRKNFEKVAGKYDLIEMDYSVEEKTSSVETKTEAGVELAPVASALSDSVQALLKLICDVKAMETAVREMKYDADKAPLGKLTSVQIRAGYSALKKIETCIEQNSFGKALVDACNEFYTRIPHSFGMKVPPLIRDKVSLKEKIGLLEALEDIEVAIRTLRSEEDNDRLHPLDRHYSSMKCDLRPLHQQSDIYKVIEKYLQNTHASTHNMYKMKLLDVFEVEKHGEDDNFNDLGNNMLLWHGSRLTNWYGILSQGLRIAPPEAPATGYMFGKGVYFADVSSKSTNYCFATKQKNVGLAVLCRVSLGNVRELTAADYAADKLPTNCHSTKGVGRVAPDPADTYVTSDGCVVPFGKPKDVGATNRSYALNYNEFVVYSTDQVKMKYLLQIEFVFP